MKRNITYLLSLKLILLTIMWLSSYTHYTSIGVDIDHQYYRVRWPGNGSIWLGGGNTQRASDPTNPYEPFDLAATFFYANPRRPEAKTTFNRWGFWYKSIQKPNQQMWVGIPSWLPVFILFLILRPYAVKLLNAKE